MTSVAFDPALDKDLVALNVSHLFESHTTGIGFRRGSVLRAYMYDFIELLAPHLPKKLVRKCEQSRTVDELDRLAGGLTIPLRGV